MSLTLTHDQTSSRTRFVIHQNRQGYWVASEKGGLAIGVFALQREALRFALFHLYPRAASRGGTRPAVR